MKILRNRKGAIETTLGFIIKIILFIVIAGSAVFIFDDVALADIKAQNAARNLGAAFDALALTTKDASVDADCPSGIIFTIEQNRILAKLPSFVGDGFAAYHYLFERDASLPGRTQLDCGSGATLEVSKTYDKTTLRPRITTA